MTGGSHAEARVSTPPRLGGLGLAGIQSGCGAPAWAKARLRSAPATRAVAPRPVHPARVRNVRRLSRLSGPRRSKGIAALLLTAAVKERTPSELEPMRHYTGWECRDYAAPRAPKSSYATAHGLRTVLPHAARRAVERAGGLRLGPRADAGRRAARLFLGLDRRAPLQRLRPLPGPAGARRVPGRPHARAAARHGREPAAAPPSGGPGRAARGAGRGERRPARRGHRPRRHAAGLPDLPVRPRRQPRPRRGRHRADPEVVERGAVRLRGALPLGRAPARAPAPGAAAAPAALHRGQQRGQRALGGAPGPAHPVLVLRADRGAAAPAPALSRALPRGRAVGRRGGGAREPGVGHAGGARRARSRGGAARHRGPLHGLPAQDVGPALRGHRRHRAGLVRPLAAPAPLVPGLSRRRLGADRHAGRGPGRPADVSRRHRLPARAAADGAAGPGHEPGPAIDAPVRGAGGARDGAREPASRDRSLSRAYPPTVTSFRFAEAASGPPFVAARAPPAAASAFSKSAALNP